MRAWFQKDLEKSRYLRKPLEIHEEEMRETRCLSKKVLRSVLLDDMTSLANWETVGEYAKMELSKEHIRGCENSVKFSSVTRLDRWPKAFGRIYTVPAVMRKVNHENWEHINRISFWVYPDMFGFHSISFRMQFHNAGNHPVPDRYDREGHHNVNLVHGKWQYVSVEIPYLHRDDVTGISFEYDMVGSEVTATDTACWYITDIMLETLAEEDLDVYEGWVPGRGRIALSGSGYSPGMEKTALINAAESGAGTFRVIETGTGKTVFTGKSEEVQSPDGKVLRLDFSALKEKGEYLIVCGGIVSRSFAVGDGVWEDSIWKALNFLFCERCGYEVPGKHYVCHSDVTVRHGERSIVANGGWHDAGDMTQTTTNTSECTYALFELLSRLRGHDESPALYERVLEEAKWGLDWILKTRFGDGYRCPSSSKSCWTNGIIGDQDDIWREAAVETIENFMCAGTEALAARILRETDPVLSAHSLKCAREDWNFAYQNRHEDDFCKHDDPNRIRTYLLKYSAAAWSAADLYETSGEECWRDRAVLCAEEIMKCQQLERAPWEKLNTGFFYDSPDHALIAHCSHRSHENEPLYALSRLTELFPDHERYSAWMYSIHLYADYITKAASLASPYGVAPSSIYHEDEAFHDKEYDMGMIARYLTDDDRRENYRAQVRNGLPLGKGYYLRRLPVAFEHRGNHVITMAAGKAAAAVAAATNDIRLSELAARQLEWIVGRNPFAESVMFGEGYDYCQEYAVLPGEMVGELGVGFAHLDEHDSPFWPQVNTCVYKEVWIRSVLYWIWLAADLHGSAAVKGKASGADALTFTNLLTGESRVFTPSLETGCYEGNLPAAAYEIRCGSTTKRMSLLPARSYRIDAPLRSYELDCQASGPKVRVTLKTGGPSAAALRWKSANLVLQGAPESAKEGGTAAFDAVLENPGKPYWIGVFPKDSAGVWDGAMFYGE